MSRILRAAGVLFCFIMMMASLPARGQIITTVAGNGTQSYSGDGGPATSATLNGPAGVVIDASGNMLIADNGNHRIRKVTTATGIITTIAGTGATGSTGDGGAATSATLNGPFELALDAAGNLYIADQNANRVRKITAATGIISTMAGTGTAGSAGDGGAATTATLNGPTGVAVDASGNVYIAEYTGFRVRKITAATGIITTIAGTGTAGSAGDGGAATSAQVRPVGLDVDALGNVYTAEALNYRIRKITAATGIITTIAGTGSAGFSGDGGAATSANLSFCNHVQLDAAGNLYISDNNNQRVRKVTAATSIITTIAGNGVSGYNGDGGVASSASLSLPNQLAFDATGNLYIADLSNQRIRKVALGQPLQGPGGVTTGIRLWLKGDSVNYPGGNPANGTAITTWKDVSGNANNAVVLAGQGTPVLNAAQINGKDVVKFTRTSQSLGTVYNVPNVDIRSVSMPKTTIFTVYKQGAKSGNEWHGIWGDDNLNFDRFFMSSFGTNLSSVDHGIVSVGPPTNFVQVNNAGVTGQTKLLTAVYDSGVVNGSTIYFNALPVQTVTDGTDPTNAQSTLRIGWDGDDNPFNGDMAEMIVYSRKLTDCEIKTVNRYLGYKYGVTLTTATISPAPDAYFCTGGSTTLTGSSVTTGATYTWLQNGNLISGANSSTYTASVAGSFQVIASAGGCADTSAVTKVSEVFPTVYVDSSIAVSGTGASWGSPKKTVWEALNMANGVSCAVNIFTKKGTYYPMTSATTAATSRDSSLRILRNNIKLYGGFAGTESSAAGRTNITGNLTTLSGDINVANDSTDNAYHVMTIVGNAANNIDTNTIVDGFTITRGHADGSGTPTVNGMIVYQSAGGGINTAGMDNGSKSSPLLQNLTFFRNNATYGGGLYGQGHDSGKSSPVVRASTFLQNRAIQGGGAHFYSYGQGGNVSPSFTACTFQYNYAQYQGGAAWFNGDGITGNQSVANPAFRSCTLDSNYTDTTSVSAGNYFGGAIDFRGTVSTPTIDNCIFTKNSSNYGGALSSVGLQNLIVDSCTFTANKARLANGGASSFQNAGITYSNCTFTSNKSAGAGGAINQTGSGILGVSACDFVTDSAGNYGGAIGYYTSASAIITDSRFLSNYGVIVGAIDKNGASTLSLLRCVFSSNKTGQVGGAMNLFGGIANFTNCVLTGNSTTTSANAGGGALHIHSGATANFYNSTLSGNTTASTSAPNGNTLSLDAGATSAVNNTIIWGTAANQIANSGTITYNYSDIKGVAATGTNLSVDPSFRNAGDPNGADNTWATADDGLQLAPCSPLINTGSNALVPAGVTTDITGATRIQLTTVDMGAYEAAATSGILYVNGSVATTGTGTSWASPFKTVTEALNVANNAACVDTIWVAAGTYYPMINSTTVATSRDSSFRILRNGIKLFGGFNGTETAFSQRNIAANATILSGDIGTPNDTTDNVRHVLTILAFAAAPLDTSTVVNGFTITKGNADGGTAFTYNGLTLIATDGGGILCAVNATGAVANVLIDSCTFTANYAGVGGGMYCAAYNNGTSSPTVRNCLFTLNTGISVAGLHSRAAGATGAANPNVLNCRFIANTGASGGAMGALSSTGAAAGPFVTNCIFSGNKATGQGGAFYSFGGTVSFNATNCVFTNNTSPNGSVINLPSGSTATFNNSTVYNPTAATGAAVLNTGTVNLNNTIIWGTSATQVSGAGTLNEAYSDVRGIAAAGTNLSVDPSFINANNPIGADGLWATSDDGLELAPCSPVKNLGSNALIPTGITTDITGVARIQQTTVDMGAYETSISATGHVYVDGTVAASGTGFTWGTAFKTVTEALTLANSAPCVDTIWVRAGTYYPMINATTVATNRDSSLRILRNGIKIFGGFNGTESLFSQRNVAANVTTLSGDIGAANDSTDNVYHVMTIVPSTGVTVDTNTRVDGFTITRGNALGATGSFTVNGQTFNRQDGGGIYNFAINTTIESSPAIANCIFTKNAANFGGAIYNGAYAANGKASPRITACTFTTNRANNDGGGLYNNGTNGGSSSPVVTNCSFIANIAGGFGAIAVNNGTATSTPQYIGCTFSGNYLTSAGGGGGISNSGSVVVNVSNSVFFGNISTNAAGTVGSGGAYQHNPGGSVSTFTNCVFVNNAANGSGDDGGGAIMNYGGTITLNDCTLYNNTTTSTTKPDANAISVTAGNTVVLNNTIVWGAAAQQIVNLGTATYNYSDIRGIAAAGTNISADPQFLNPSNPIGADATWATSDDGLRLTPCSPAIDAGSNALIPAGVTTDITGAARIQQTTVDMGAYEMPYGSTGLPSTTIAMSPANPVCAATSVTFTATTVAPGAGPSYQWYKNNVAVAGAVTTTYTATGWVNGDVVTVVHTNNDCNLKDTAASITVVVTPVPPTPGAITGNTPVCPGSVNTYSITSVSGATSYTWTLPAGFTGTSGTASISTTAGATGGTITVTANNACGSSLTATLAVAVTTPPTGPGTITGNAIVCSGIAQTYSLTGITGATTYAWTVPAGWTVNAGAGTAAINVTPTTTGGSVSVIAGNACGSASAALAVTSGSTPAAPGTITGATPVCAGSVNTYSVAPVAGNTYNWTLPSGWAGTSTASSISTTAGAAGGTISVTTTNGCGTSAASTLAVAVNAVLTPSVSITNSSINNTICAGASVTFTANPVNGGTSPAYQWKKNGVAVATGNPYIATGLVNGDQIKVVMTSSSPCVTTATDSSAATTITVISAPAAPGAISGPASVCANTTNTYSITAVTGATSYNWILPSGWTGASAATSIAATAGAAGGTVQVSASNSCFTSAAAALAVAVTVPLTPSLSISANPGTTLCAGTSITFTATPVNGGTTPAYQWLKNGVAVATGATYTTSTLANNDVITAVMTTSLPCYTALTATSNALTITVNAIPPAPGAITGNTAVCNGSQQPYSVAPVSTATSYTWTLPAGWSGANTTNTILATAGAAGGTITVTANNQCGASATAATLAVSVTSIPATPGTISGSTTPCANTSQTYSIAPVSGATSYNWTLPAGWNGVSSTTSIATTTGSAGGSITVSAANTCGASAPATLAVAPVNPPATPGAIAGNTTPCSGSTQVYSIAAVSGATSYTWTGPAGWSGGSATNSITYTANAQSGTVQVVANGVCGTSGPSTLAVSPILTVMPAVSIATPSTTICQNTGATFTATPVNGGPAPAYQWKKNGLNVGTNASVYTDLFLVNGDVITVVMTSNAPCVTAAAATSNAIAMTVTPTVIPGVSINTVPPIYLCAGVQLTFTTTTVGGGAGPQYQWYQNGLAINGATGPTYTSSAFANGDTITVMMTTSAACAAVNTVLSNKVGLTVTQNVTPAVTITANPGANVGTAATVTFTATITNGGATPAYQWLKNGQAIAFATGSTYTTGGLHDGDLISVRLTSYAPCANPVVVTSAAIRMNVSTGAGAVSGNGWTGSLVLYPNPNSGHFTIAADWGSGHGGERVRIELLNTLGQMVWYNEVVPAGSQWTVPVWLGETIANGIYQLRLRTENMNTVKPVLIQR